MYVEGSNYILDIYTSIYEKFKCVKNVQKIKSKIDVIIFRG